MNINPNDYPAMDVALFDYADKWVMNDGTGCPVEPTTYVKVMYSNGFIANRVRIAHAWTNWTGGRNYWLKPDDNRLYIMMFCII